MMKKLCTCISMLCIYSYLPAKGLMPAVERIHNKIDKTMKETNNLTFREILAKAGIDNNVVRGQVTLCGPEAANATKEKSLHDIEHDMDESYWSNQADLVKELSTLLSTSKMQAADMLKKKIVEKYQHSKMPMMTFAQDLAKEEELLKDLLNELLRQSNTSTMKSEDKAKRTKHLKKLYDRHLVLTKTLQDLIQITNTLLFM